MATLGQVGAQAPARYGLRLWVEVLLVGAFYGAYTLVRDASGADRQLAYVHARDIVRLERSLGIFHEAWVQRTALAVPHLEALASYFYQLAHFAVPVVVLIWLFRRHPAGYRSARNALAWTTAISLVVFIVFPVMPPRLLPPQFHFVDSVFRTGHAGVDSFLMREVGNQYAAMPSLHVAWAIWSAWAVQRNAVRRPRVCWVWVYPFATAAAVVITANHYFLDAVAGVVVAGVGWWLADHVAIDRRTAHQDDAPVIVDSRIGDRAVQLPTATSVKVPPGTDGEPL